MKTFILLVSLALSFVSLGQKPALNHWSAAVSFGANKPINPYAKNYFSNSICFPSVNIDGRYMTNSYLGFGAQLSYDQFKFDHFGTISGSSNFKSNYISLSALTIFNLGQAFQFYEFAPRLGLLASAGVGISSLFNDSLKLGINKGSDEMMNFQFVLTPMVKITNRISVIAQLNLIAHMYQNRTYDLTAKVLNRGLDGFLLSGSIGVNMAIGKEDEHVDWYSPRRFQEQSLMQTQSKYDSLVAQMKDEDQDGVPNYLDKEPGTAAGQKVNLHGVTDNQEMSYETSEENADLEGFDGVVEFPEKLELFYSVQVGYYELTDSVDYVSKYGIEAKAKELPNGAVRYLFGVYDNFQTAQQALDVAFSRNIIGSFIIVYYKGKRITIAQAEKLLLKYGRIVLYPSK